MNQDQMEQINRVVKDSIQLHFNGKLDKLNTKFDAYVVKDMEWKATAQPTIDLGNNVRGFGKVFVYFLGIVGGIAGAIYATMKIFQK